MSEYILTPRDLLALIARFHRRDWLGLALMATAGLALGLWTSDWSAGLFAAALAGAIFWRLDSRWPLGAALALLIAIPILRLVTEQGWLYLGGDGSNALAVAVWYLLAIGVIRAMLELRVPARAPAHTSGEPARVPGANPAAPAAAPPARPSVVDARVPLATSARRPPATSRAAHPSLWSGPQPLKTTTKAAAAQGLLRAPAGAGNVTAPTEEPVHVRRPARSLPAAVVPDLLTRVWVRPPKRRHAPVMDSLKSAAGPSLRHKLIEQRRGQEPPERPHWQPPTMDTIRRRVGK